jgi:hypothetical protein
MSSMSVSPIFSRQRKTTLSRGWFVIMAAFLLPWAFASSDVLAQSPLASTEDAEAKAKQSPRLLGRLFGSKTPPEAQSVPKPPVPPVAKVPVPESTVAPPAAPLIVPAPTPAVASVGIPTVALTSTSPVDSASPPLVDPALVPAQLSNYYGYSYQNISNVTVGSEADRSFVRRLFDSYRDEPTQTTPPDPNAPPSRRGMAAPFTAPPMPFSDFIGPTIGVNDTSVFPLMDALYRGKNGQAWKDSRIKIYGWADPSYNASTSKNSNVPVAYSIVPNKIELSQAILIFERPVDTVQQDHFDWGFRFTNLYGIDYRYTTAKGWFSNQLLKHNDLYGYDPLQLQVDLYMPHIGDGTNIRIGRYISPLDIEAQLSPDNFLYTHSLMFAYDPYTFTGVQFTTKINDQWQIIYGVQAGNDMAPWNKSAQPNGEILVKWVSKSNKDSIFGGLDSIGKGYYSDDHDDLQVAGFTWSHKFNDKFATMTEQYYIWQRNALLGGTVTNGPAQPYFEGVGAGTLLKGLSSSYGIVNYTSYVLSDKSILVFRSDCLDDFRGERTGIPGAYFENTLGYVRHLNSWAIIRPEIRFDYTGGQKGYDNGTRREQFTFSSDLIIRF